MNTREKLLHARSLLRDPAREIPLDYVIEAMLEINAKLDEFAKAAEGLRRDDG